MATVNRQITLAARPVGLPKVSDFQLAYVPVPVPAAGEVLVRSAYLSLDPHLRGLMNVANSDSGVRPVGIGEVMAGGAAAIVLESKDPKLRAGDAVVGMLGWQEFAAVPAGELRKLDPGTAPISTALGVLGIPGLTAYFGLLEICRPRHGETAVVSGAVGAIGTIAGQIATIKGCRVVGLSGSESDLSWLLDELGFDAALSDRSAPELHDELLALCPEGIDVYLDNEGGETTDAVVRRINTGARIAVCGQRSQDNQESPALGPRWLGHLIARAATLHGCLVSRYTERFPEGRKQLGRWLKQGKLKYVEDVAQGIESAPQAFIGMLQGKSHGQQLVQLAGP